MDDTAQREARRRRWREEQAANTHIWDQINADLERRSTHLRTSGDPVQEQLGDLFGRIVGLLQYTQSLEVRVARVEELVVMGDDALVNRL